MTPRPLVQAALHYDTWTLYEKTPKNFLDAKTFFFLKIIVTCPGCTDQSPGVGRFQRCRQRAPGRLGTTTFT